MDKRIVLCLDAQSVRNPEMVGLAGEALDALPWLECCVSAEEARNACRRLSFLEEVWAVSCDDMEPVNLAAAIKKDKPECRVYLVACGQSGSLASRVARARIDGVWPESFFLKRYAQAKQCFSSHPRLVQGVQATSSGETQLIRAVSQEKKPEESGAGAAEATSREEGSVLRQGEGRTDSENKDASAASRASLRANSSASSGGHVIAVASGSGGCGKSTMAVLFSVMAAKAGYATVLLDADLQFGDTHFLLGDKDALHIEEAIEEPGRMGRMREGLRDGKPAVLAAPRRLESAEVVVAELPRILEAMRADYDVVVVNTGSFWSEVHAQVLEAADSVAFLIDQRPSSLRATVHAVELCARLGIATGSFNYAVNRHKRESLLSAVDVSCALRGAHAMELPDGGRLVDELLGAGYPEELLETRSEFVECVLKMLIRLLPAEMEPSLKEAWGQPRKRKAFLGKGGKA